MAVFGSPYPGVKDARNCCLAALAMVANLEMFNQERSRQGVEPKSIGIGIGINTGDVLFYHIIPNTMRWD